MIKRLVLRWLGIVPAVDQFGINENMLELATVQQHMLSDVNKRLAKLEAMYGDGDADYDGVEYA